MIQPERMPLLTDIEWNPLDRAERALQWARYECDELKVKETGGEDRGPRIAEYLRSAGINRPAPWCASAVTFCLLKAGMKRGEMPINPASACNWIEWGRKRKSLIAPKRGCLFAWCDARRWKGHIGFVSSVIKVGPLVYIKTIEGNTNEAGSRQGDSWKRKTRLVTKKFSFIEVL